MSTTSIHHRPVPFYAAAAAAVAVGALAVGSVAVAVSHDSGHPGAPGGQPQTSVQQNRAAGAPLPLHDQRRPRDARRMTTSAGGPR